MIVIFGFGEVTAKPTGHRAIRNNITVIAGLCALTLIFFPALKLLHSTLP